MCGSSRMSQPVKLGLSRPSAVRSGAKAFMVQCTGRGNGEKGRSGSDGISDVGNLSANSRKLPFFVSSLSNRLKGLTSNQIAEGRLQQPHNLPTRREFGRDRCAPFLRSWRC